MNALSVTSDTQRDIPSARHVVCFWKRNDLGLFRQRPDRWIEHWSQDPEVEKILVFEPPMEHVQLKHMLRLSTTLEATSASEYALLLALALKKHSGLLDRAKVRYKTYIASDEDRGDHHTYLRWMRGTLQAACLNRPLVVMWPPCFTHLAVIRDLNPSQVVTDLDEDPRSTPGQGRLPDPIEKQYRGFLDVSHRVISPSRRLTDTFSTYFGQHIEHVPNARLKRARDLGLPAPAVGQMKTNPVIGYVGNLRDIDNPQTLLHGVRQHLDKQFWFFGQTHGAPLYAQAKELPNCRFFGTLPQDHIQPLLSELDAMIVPYKHVPVHPAQDHQQFVVRSGQIALIHVQGMSASKFSDALNTVF